MRKRSRRGRGRGRRTVSSFVETLPGGYLETQTTPDPVGVGEGVETGENTETAEDQTATEDVSDDTKVTADIGQSVLVTVSSPRNSPPYNNSSTRSSSCSSLNGDAGSDTGDMDHMHMGFMQTGPNNYRVGSTVVNLNNGSDDDIVPEFRQSDICLQVECGDNKAFMYMSKLYQGSKGRCIELGGKWLTPNEFQAVSGRESAKDWKRSIRHQGRSLKLLLSKNVLDVHPAACRCDSCSQLQQLNGKAGPAGDTAKGAFGGDTSGEDNRKSCNGGAGSSKTKKRKQPSGAAKMAKMMATIPTNTTTKLEPIGITIPQPLEKLKDDEEKVLEIPSMDSPLFKDIPSKKVESSSDSSSSSDGSSSSDDSSSSGDDSDDDDEEEKKKNSDTAQQTESPGNPLKARTPIKLTISNVGKPSAKVVATASTEVSDTNSSDSDTDMEDNEAVVKVQTNPLKGDMHDFLGDCHAKANSLQPIVQSESKEDSKNNSEDLRNKDKDQLKNRSDLMNSVTGLDMKDMCKDSDLITDSVLNNCKHSVCTDLSVLTVKGVNLQKLEDIMGNKTVQENKNSSFISSMGDNSSFISSMGDNSSLRNGNTEPDGKRGQPDETVGEETKTIAEFVQTSKALLPEELKKVKHNTESPARKENNLEDIHHADGFILSLNSDLYPENAKFTLSNSHKNQNSLEVQDLGEVITVSKAGCVNETQGCTLSEEGSKQTTVCKTLQNFFDDSLINFSRHKQNSPKDEIHDKISETDKSHQEFPENIDSICETKDNKLCMKTSHSDGVNSDISVTTKADTNSCLIIQNKDTVEFGKTQELGFKDISVLSHLPQRTTAFNITSSSVTTITTTTNSGNILSPTLRSNSKGSGFTNGIPDNENPFITWTKYDDDDSGPVTSSLPASSLVQALACAPFPSLALPGEASLSQISPLGVAVPQLSPLGLAGLSPGSSQLSRLSPGCQIPQLSSPSAQRLRSTPGTFKQQLSPPLSRQVHESSSDGSSLTNNEDGKTRTTQKSVKRTSRLSNIIDSLRTSKEKQAASSSQISGSQDKRSTLDFLMGPGRKSPLVEPSSVTGQKSSSSSSSSSPVFSAASLGSEQRSSSERLFHNRVGFPHHLNADAPRSSLDAARVQTINSSFNALKNDLDKGKRMLENLEMMRNGLVDPYGKSGLLDVKSRKLDCGQSQTRSKLSSLSLPSSSAIATSAPSSSSRPSSQQSVKPSAQSYPSSSSSSSNSSRSSTAITTNGSGLSSGSGNSINSAMFQAAPSAALAAAHMELNAAAANILTFQHMYGMHDPYMMKILMSNPFYLQRMMEFQKHAIDPLMLQQLEVLEAAAAMEKSKTNKEQQAAINAQSILWQAQAASILQHQHMQQLQLHHQQQQLQQHVAAVREQETIAAIMASKSSSLNTHTNKTIGSISTGQSAKSLLASSSTLSPSSSLSSSSSKRQHSIITSSPSEIYSRDGPSLEKKLRSSHQGPSHSTNHSSNQTPSSSNTSSLSSSSSRHAQVSSKPTSSSIKQRVNNGALSNQPKHDFFDLPGSLQLSAAASPNLWGLPPILQPPLVDMARMPRVFERSGEVPSSSSSSTRPAGSEAPGTEVLDLSVKPKSGKL